ncbi:hypothetical protein, partial [Actinotalea sp.]|uniref:hypothetical protein n=1 Tax=Actinotalea sp. TaxID=1872145 RepID=UPI003561FD68
MTAPVWILVTDTTLLGAAMGLARTAGGPVTIVAVGTQRLADAAASLGPDEVLWAEPGPDQPAEAFASAVAAAAAAAGPHLLLGSPAPASRVLLGAAAARCGAALVSGVVSVTAAHDGIAAERLTIGHTVLESVVTAGPLAAIVGGEDSEAAPGTPAPVLPMPGAPSGALHGARR